MFCVARYSPRTIRIARLVGVAVIVGHIAQVGTKSMAPRHTPAVECIPISRFAKRDPRIHVVRMTPVGFKGLPVGQFDPFDLSINQQAR